ncbi:MAG TPA: hypothetical protein VI997_03440 [Candidatus Thermoplasmatota archaeon]|nr:hypothetical protein [Candidatus Thermoplasmatota archaeon]
MVYNSEFTGRRALVILLGLLAAASTVSLSVAADDCGPSGAEDCCEYTGQMGCWEHFDGGTGGDWWVLCPVYVSGSSLIPLACI